MATKKAAAKNTSAPAKAAVATKSPTKTAPAKKTAATTKAPVAKMTKTEIVRSMAERLELPTKQVAALFDIMTEMAIAQTQASGEFMIPGLGKLVKAERKARIGRNPATGEAITIAAKTTVKFRISKAIKDSISPPKR